MLARGLGRRLLVLARLAQSSQGASSAALVDLSSGYTTKEDRVVSDGGMALSPSSSFSRSWHFSRGRFLMRLFSRVLAWTKAVQLWAFVVSVSDVILLFFCFFLFFLRFVRLLFPPYLVWIWYVLILLLWWLLISPWIPFARVVKFYGVVAINLWDVAHSVCCIFMETTSFSEELFVLFWPKWWMKQEVSVHLIVRRSFLLFVIIIGFLSGWDCCGLDVEAVRILFLNESPRHRVRYSWAPMNCSYSFSFFLLSVTIGKNTLTDPKSTCNVWNNWLWYEVPNTIWSPNENSYHFIILRWWFSEYRESRMMSVESRYSGCFFD